MNLEPKRLLFSKRLPVPQLVNQSFELPITRKNMFIPIAPVQRQFAQDLSPQVFSNRRVINFKVTNHNKTPDITISSIESLNFSKINYTKDAKSPSYSSSNVPKPSRRHQSYQGYDIEIKNTSRERSPKISLCSSTEITKKSKDLLETIRSPQQIFTEALELKKLGINTSKKPKIGKERMKALAKNLDIPLNLHEGADFSREYDIMKQIPAKYYQKLKEIQNKDTEPRRIDPSPKRVNHLKTHVENELRCLAVQENKTKPEIILVKQSQPLPEVINKPNLFELTDLRQQRYSPLRLTTDSLDISNRSERDNYKPIIKQVDFNTEMSSKRSKKGSEINEWMTRTNILKQDIDNFMIKTENYLDFVTLCEDKNESNFTEISVDPVQPDETQTNWDHYDLENVLEEAERHKKIDNLVKVGVSRRRNLSSKKTAITNELNFYKTLLYKQQKTTEKILNKALKPTPKYLAQIGEAKNH